jgi:hypothetical protein
MYDHLDILVIDNDIRNNFTKQRENICIYQEKLLDIEETLKNKDLHNKNIENLKITHTSLSKYIDDIINEVQLNFYIIKTVDLIEEYKKILTQPMKISFLGKPNKSNKEKQKIIDSFMTIANQYIKIETDDKNIKTTTTCKNCSNKKDFDIIDKDIYICNICYSQQIILKHNSSYNDIDRINISSKYMYDRKVHFRDCIKQYQGKQNSTIPNKIYKELIIEFQNHHLLEDNEHNKKEKFKNITKNHVLLFLKELGYSSHYENVHLIHFNLTDIKPNDISHLEDKLLDDFDNLTNLYDKMYKDINRKNFINTQYVLYNLLCRHKYPCKKEEFIVLKTIDRKFFHDEICKALFEQLGWNFTPYF